MRIATNITAMNTYRNYTVNNSNVAKAAEKLSSGYKINSAADDAAGLAITEKMKAQINGLNMASKNSQDAISLIQTAEGALSETQSMLQRMNELAVQSATGTNESFDRSAISAEFDQLKTEINQISDTTTFNNMNILDGSLGAPSVSVATTGTTLNTGLSLGSTVSGAYSVYANVGMSASTAGTFTLATGSVNATTGAFTAGTAGTDTSLRVSFTDGSGNVTNTVLDLNSAIQGTVGNGQSFTLNLSSAGLGTYSIAAANGGGTAAKADFISQLNAKSVVTQAGTGAGGAIKIQVGAMAGDQMDLAISNMDSTSLGVSTASISTQNGASAAITSTRAAINTVSNQRALMGAMQNRLDHKINNLSAQSENLSAAESRIKDVDIAKEMTEYTKNNILSQASTAMLAQANSAPQNVLSLLK